MIRKSITWAAAAMALVALHPNAFAAAIVPGGYANVTGNSNNCIPFTCIDNGDHYQQVYDAAAFGGATGNIDSIAFRLNSTDVFPSGVPFLPPTPNDSFNLSLQLQVSLSYTTTTPETVSTTFADNLTTGTQQVFSGTVNWSATQLPGDQLNPFNLAVNFDNPFYFNGQQNLLLDITVLNSDSILSQLGGAPRYLDAAFDPAFGRTFGAAGSSGGGFNPTYGLITQFDMTPVAVPEPPSVLLMLAAVAACFAIRHKLARPA